MRLWKVVAIYIWHDRFNAEPYMLDGKLKTFSGGYQSAWNYIVANNLPLGASAVEIYTGAMEVSA